MNRALKGRLGHYARPEGRDEPFRARVFAEPALQRTDKHGTLLLTVGHDYIGQRIGIALWLTRSRR